MLMSEEHNSFDTGCEQPAVEHQRSGALPRLDTQRASGLQHQVSFLQSKVAREVCEGVKAKAKEAKKAHERQSAEIYANLSFSLDKLAEDTNPQASTEITDQPLRPFSKLARPVLAVQKRTSANIRPRGSSHSGRGAHLIHAAATSHRFLRIMDSQARLAFLRDHPFFEGTSQNLRERLAPQLVRRSNSDDNGPQVLTQGQEPTSSTDYLFLTSPESHMRIEVAFDGQVISTLGASAVFGQEVIFGITTTFIFGVRLAVGSILSLWAIPRSVLQTFLSKDVFREDFQILKERAHDVAVEFLHDWYQQPTSNMRLRLFDHTSHSFKHALVRAMNLELQTAQSVIRERAVTEDTCLCIFRGEAQACVTETHTIPLSHAAGTSQWAAWWGLLEVLDVCLESPAQVVAVTDCIVWHLSASELKNLRREFPMECRLFDKVAIEHVKSLRCSSMTLCETPILQGCGSEFIKEIESAAEPRICVAGETLIEEDNEGTELFFLLRGRASVHKRARQHPACMPSTSAHQPHRCTPTASSPVAPRDTLRVGACFGEVAALGFQEQRVASVICETICDIRAVSRRTLVNLLSRFPEEAPRFQQLAQLHGYNWDPPARVEFSDLELFSRFSYEFLDDLGKYMKSKTTFAGQIVLEQHANCSAMYTLIKGRVCLEVDMALVADLGPPAVLGEEALVEPNARCHFTLRSKFLCFFQVVTAADAANVFARFPEDRDRMQETAMENAESLKRIRLRNMHRRIEPTSSSSEQVSHQEEHKKDTQQQDVPNDVPTTEALRTFFKDSDPGFLEFISEHLEKCIFFGGQILLHEGSEGNFMWLLQRGKLVVEVGGMRVGEVQEGGYIGEAVLLGQAVRRTATCRAVGLVTAFKLESSVVLEAFELFPKEKSRVEQMMKLRERSNKFLASCNADGNSGQASIPLPLGSTAVKGASKILSKMSRSGKKKKQFNWWCSCAKRGDIISGCRCQRNVLTDCSASLR